VNPIFQITQGNRNWKNQIPKIEGNFLLTFLQREQKISLNDWEVRKIGIPLYLEIALHKVFYFVEEESREGAAVHIRSSPGEN